MTVVAAARAEKLIPAADVISKAAEEKPAAVGQVKVAASLVAVKPVGKAARDLQVISNFAVSW